MFIILTRNRLKKLLKDSYLKGLQYGYCMKKTDKYGGIFEGQPKILREVEQILKEYHENKA